MRYAPGHKEQTRAKILRAAGEIFRREGYHAAGVDQIMEGAGLTAGGFYGHFASKEALLADTLAPGAIETAIAREEDLEGASGREWIEAFVDRYLSRKHVDSNEDGCPLASLVSEVGRAGEAVKASFESNVCDLAKRLQDRAGEADASEGQALAVIALCVGGLSMARSVKDEALSERILASCREMAKTALAAPAKE